MSLVGIILLSACVSGTPAATTGLVPTVAPTMQPTAIPATEAPTPMPTVDPFATYENSFDAIADLTASGITSNQNGIPTTSKSAIRINKDIVHSGSQSLEASGIVGTWPDSSMSIDLPIRNLIGKETVDLSNKTLNVSVFIPKSSPIDKVYFTCSNDKQYAIIPSTNGGGADVKGRWFSYDLNIERYFENNRLAAWGTSRSASENILQNCEMISYVGLRFSQGGATPANFMIDDISWADASYRLEAVPIDKNVDSLRKYADLHNLKVGSALLAYDSIDYMMDPKYVQTLAQEFNLVTGIGSSWPEQKPADPSEMYLDYTGSDAIFKMGNGAQLSQKGATGGWHGNLPMWLLNEDFHNLQPYLESRIEKDMNQYKGKMYIWDVFNETTNASGFTNRQGKGKAPSIEGLAPYGLLYSPWVDGGDTSLIKAAFIKARQTDPNAKLFLNDCCGNELIGGAKAEIFYGFVADMKKEGIPIDGVGFQLHLCLIGNTLGECEPGSQKGIDQYLDSLNRSVKRYADLGLLVEFSEVEVAIRNDDIDLSTPAGKDVYEQRLETQAEVYRGLMKIVVENKNVAAFIIWLVSDRFQQGGGLPGYGDSSLFDAEYKPKPAYNAMLEELKKQSGDLSPIS